MNSRRDFLLNTGAACMATAAPMGLAAAPSPPRKAQIAITLDLEMSRNFPEWEDTHWDYEKGNLNDAAKHYTQRVCRLVRESGGIVHNFVVGRTLEQRDVDWLREIARAGHALGNHTYDHVNITATKPEKVQYRFQRAPWLMEGRPPLDVIERNIRFCTEAMRERLGIKPNGFRTPGGFRGGLSRRPELQSMLKRQGFNWVSSAYAGNYMTPPQERPTVRVFNSIIEAQAASQPFRYPSGLLEIPMSPISDIGAFRGGRWPLEDFIKAIRMALNWAIENRAVMDFLAHPSCLGVVDPDLETISMICETVRSAGEAAEIVDLGHIAETYKGN